MTEPDDPRAAGSYAGSPLPAHLDPRGPRSGSRRSPVAAGRRRRRRLLRTLSWVALGMSLLLFTLTGVGYALLQKYDGRISRIPGINIALPGTSKPASAPNDAKNVLLVGSDTRDTTGGQFQGTGAATVTGQRSDTVILAHLYGGSSAAELVSFPRDSYVTIPAYTDSKTGTHYREHLDKLNAAFSEGGPTLLIATIERLSGIRVDNYVQIDFAGFQSMVDKLGGVQVCLLHAAKESNSGIDLPAGTQTIKGAQALAFVRQRYGLPAGDLDRIKRQQAFIASIARKALSSGTLLNPVKLNGFLDAATSSVQVDSGLSATGLTKLALRLRHFNAGGVTFTTLPVAGTGLRGGQDVVLLDDAKLATLFGALKRDQNPAAAAPRPSPTAAVPLTVAPKAVRVGVLNGAGTSGLARKVSDDLRAAGFTVVSTGNGGTGATGTVVRYGPSQAEAARTLAAAVTGATLQPDPALGSTVQLVAGSSYTGVVPVSVGSSPAPAPTAAPSTGAPAVTAANDNCVN